MAAGAKETVGPISAAPVGLGVAAARSDVNASLAALLKLEDEARDVESIAELNILAANEALRLTGARQVFVVREGIRRHEIAAVSSMGAFDRNAPLVQAIERMVARLAAESGLAASSEFEARAFASANDTVLQNYPFRWMMWLPLLARDKRPLGGVLLARETAWTKPDRVIGERLSRIVAYAWAALDSEGRATPRVKVNRWMAVIVAAVLALLLFVPVPMTTLAPFEIGSQDELVIAAPIDGVIEAIEVEPNAAVVEGQVLVRLSDTMLRNKLEVAEREVAVAAARLTKTEQLAFADLRGRHEMGVTRTELALRTAERDFAKEILAKTEIRASRAGLAVFTDKRELTGKPVTTGERILHLADPKRVEIRIDVPVSDAMILKPRSAAKIFLDSDPLRPRLAVVRHADYLARLRADVLAFRVIADLAATDTPPPRLGARGTAQLFGDRVPLGFYLFRRPISALRQRIGL